ncbi:MAG TPA: ABC transporter ATP-binding protein [Caldilineaceae bacterium]|nr:ABC transporter ATP-binding protein [Caldilineaceae bacterium]
MDRERAAGRRLRAGPRRALRRPARAHAHLGHRRDDMVDKLSKGLKQRLSLARTLCHDPAVLILDEPASGLDPRARVEIRELLVELAKMGKTIFFSTHILADVNEICTHIGILEAGEMIAQGSMADMRAQLQPHREITVTLRDQDAVEVLKATVSGIAEVVGVTGLEQKNGRPRVRIDFNGDDEGVARLNQAILGANIAILGINEETKDLEAMFMRITRGIVT